jgi:putative Holliday junction resolvase
MGRIIAIDYGKKRTGIAVSDPLKMIAGGLTTVPSHTAVAFIRDYLTKEEVELIILGEPRQMNYEYSENMQRVLAFKKQLLLHIPAMEVKMVDERFTSVLAHRAMLEGGLKKIKRQDKELVDELSATILLQSYLETIRI